MIIDWQQHVYLLNWLVCDYFISKERHKIYSQQLHLKFYADDTVVY